MGGASTAHKETPGPGGQGGHRWQSKPWARCVNHSSLMGFLLYHAFFIGAKSGFGEVEKILDVNKILDFAKKPTGCKQVFSVPVLLKFYGVEGSGQKILKRLFRTGNNAEWLEKRCFILHESLVSRPLFVGSPPHRLCPPPTPSASAGPSSLLRISPAFAFRRIDVCPGLQWSM